MSESTNEWLYLHVGVRMGRGWFGVRGQVLAHGCLECLCLPSLSFPSSYQRESEGVPCTELEVHERYLLPITIGEEDIVSSKHKNKTKRKAENRLLPHSRTLSYST